MTAMKYRSILEVWDYRLSTAQPINYRGGCPGKEPTGTWWATVVSQSESNELLEAHDTGVDVVDGDLHDGGGLSACFNFYRTVRDKYSRDGIEDLKPEVAKIRTADILRQKATVAFDEKLKEIEAMGDK